MARRKNFIAIEGSAFADYAEKLDKLGADLKQIFDESLTKAGEKVQEDVRGAVSASNLPARGKYSTGDTESSVLDPEVIWSGSVGELPLGFDKTKPGAGGFLITGTPKMAPDYALAKIFTQKSYERNIKKEIEADLQKAIDSIMTQS